MAVAPGSPYPMISIAEALAIVLANTNALAGEPVSLKDACGRTLAEDVHARDDLPPFPASIKDGYAVVSADPPGVYPIVGEARAGHGVDLQVQPGEVAYITTGAPLPSGADAVVQVEDTLPQDAGPDGVPRVKICKAPTGAGQDIRAVGSDIASGDLVLSAGEAIGAAEVGILATVGASTVHVHRQTVVAVLSTGDEVVEPDTQQLGPGQIRDCNRAMLCAAAAQAGARVIDLGIARDQDGHLEGCLARALELGADVIISSGGVSMGDKDLIKPMLERSGQVHFGRVLMKPGKPLTFATMEPSAGRKVLFFGLPGNPASSFVCFHLVVLPCLQKQAGVRQPGLRRVHARLAEGLKMDPERPEYHRVTLHWQGGAEAGGTGPPELVAVSSGRQISSRLLSARSANGLIELPQRAGVLPAGSVVSCLLIDDLRSMPLGES